MFYAFPCVLCVSHVWFMVLGTNGLAIRAPDAKLPPNCTELRRGAFGTSPGAFFLLIPRCGVALTGFLHKLFEGVCVTAVILAPGVCGRWGPSHRSWHHFRGCGGSGCVFQKRRSCCYLHDFSAREVPKPGLAVKTLKKQMSDVKN